MLAISFNRSILPYIRSTPTQANKVMYNLAEYFETKTNSQIRNLIKGRLVKNETANQFIRENDCFPLNEVSRIQTQLKKANVVEDDCTAWLNDAVLYVSAEFWNGIIEELGLCYDGNCHADRVGG